MSYRPWPSVALVLVVVLGAGACKPIPTRPAYRSPVISSVTAFPTLVGQGDSVMVTVVASDPDGDSLVYDWSAYAGLEIRGATHGGYLFSTPSPSHVFYRSAQPLDDSVAVVECIARDTHGGADGVHIFIRLRD